MALRDHSLDEGIIRAAREEFMSHGFLKASLHEIARKSGTTTGALYTRYRNKDDLFMSLVRNVLDSAQEYAKPIYDRYMSVMEHPAPEDFVSVIHFEMDVFRQLLFDNYDACVLLMCRSQGSSVEKMLNDMMRMKSQQTCEFFRSISRSEIDVDGIGLLISSQFDFFRQILEMGYSPSKAVSCMKTVEIYQTEGWKALFRAIL